MFLNPTLDMPKKALKSLIWRFYPGLIYQGGYREVSQTRWSEQRGRLFGQNKLTVLVAKLYIPSTLNIDFILWHTQLIVCAENIKSWFKSWIFHFTFQSYTMPHTLNCMYVSLFEFHIWILRQFWCCPKRPVLPRHIRV